MTSKKSDRGAQPVRTVPGPVIVAILAVVVLLAFALVISARLLTPRRPDRPLPTPTVSWHVQGALDRGLACPTLLRRGERDENGSNDVAMDNALG